MKRKQTQGELLDLDETKEAALEQHRLSTRNELDGPSWRRTDPSTK
jgi:hypothetical protein